MQKVTDQLLKQITRHIVDSVHPERIILFGSYAWGRPDQTSDIDLLVVVSSSDFPGYKRARAVYRCLRDIIVPLDVMVLTRQEVERSVNIPSSLAYKIMREGNVLYG